MATCNQPGCAGKILARGLCAAHYRRARAERMAGQRCRATGCTTPPHARGLCQRHYLADTQGGSIEHALARLLDGPQTSAPEAALSVRLAPEAHARLRALAEANGEMPTRTARRLLLDALTSKKT